MSLGEIPLQLGDPPPIGRLGQVVQDLLGIPEASRHQVSLLHTTYPTSAVRVEPSAGLGNELSQAARVVGVDRRTIERWLEDSDVLTRLNGRRRAVWDGLHDRVRTLVDRALGVFELTLEVGDFEAARESLRIWGPAVAQGLRADPDRVLQVVSNLVENRQGHACDGRVTDRPFWLS